MTTNYDKTALPQSPTTFAHLYPIEHYPHPVLSLSIKEPEGEYSANVSSAPDTAESMITLRDRLEAHFARYHFHHLSLMAIGSSDDSSDHWEFGAHLAGRALQQESEALIAELSDVN